MIGPCTLACGNERELSGYSDSQEKLIRDTRRKENLSGGQRFEVS